MTAREFIALKDLKDECWSQDTEQLALAMEDYAKHKSWESFKAAKEVMRSPMTPYGEEFAREEFNQYWEENNK